MKKELELSGLDNPALFFREVDEAFNCDLESMENKGQTIISLYNNVSDDERELLDDLMIHLTGSSIKSLYKDAIKNKNK